MGRSHHRYAMDGRCISGFFSFRLAISHLFILRNGKTKPYIHLSLIYKTAVLLLYFHKSKAPCVGLARLDY
jgi:hypothetical protein